MRVFAHPVRTIMTMRRAAIAFPLLNLSVKERAVG